MTENMKCQNQIPEIFVGSLADEDGNKYQFEGELYKSLEEIQISSSPYACLMGGGGWVYLVVKDQKVTNGYDAVTQAEVNAEVAEYRRQGFPKDWESPTLKRWRERKVRRQETEMRPECVSQKK